MIFGVALDDQNEEQKNAISYNSKNLPPPSDDIDLDKFLLGDNDNQSEMDEMEIQAALDNQEDSFVRQD